MKDWRGTEYDVGSTVLYPRTSGRCNEVVEGVVDTIGTYEGYGYFEGSYGNHVMPVVWIQPLRSSRFQFGSEEESRWRQGVKPVRITVTTNITAL